MSEREEEIKELAKAAEQKKETLETVARMLENGTRRNRQNAAAIFAVIAKDKPELVVPYIDLLVDSLNQPEAQTRWESLDALTEMVAIESRLCDKAVPGAEASLFDEDNGPVRLSAMRFLCRLGATTPNRSLKVWPLIDEGIQCYHGDLEFSDMLIAINEFASGKLDKSVKDALKERFSFDATSGKGSMKRKAQQIIANL